VVLWRAFAYSASAGDRAKQAQEESIKLHRNLANNLLDYPRRQLKLDRA
jgi:hypothetical protein